MMPQTLYNALEKLLIIAAEVFDCAKAVILGFGNPTYFLTVDLNFF